MNCANEAATWIDMHICMQQQLHYVGMLSKENEWMSESEWVLESELIVNCEDACMHPKIAFF